MQSRFLLFIIAVAFLTPTTVIANDSQPASWEPSRIKQTIAVGSTLEVPVTLLSRINLSNATLWITPELKPFVGISPETSIHLDKGNLLAVSLLLTIPSSTPVGQYEGTLHLRSGKRTLSKPLQIHLDVVESDLTLTGSIDLPFDAQITIELKMPNGSFLVGSQGTFTLVEAPQSPFMIQGVVDGKLVAMTFFIPGKLDNSLSCKETAASLLILGNLLFVPPQVIEELLELIKSETEIISLAELLCDELRISTDALVNPSPGLETAMKAASIKIQQVLAQLLAQSGNGE